MIPHIDFGKRSGYTIPRVNIGAMRLPGDLDEAVALIRYAIDKGMRYIDTSRGYGDSEEKLARALKDGYREKVILSTKWAPWIKKIDPNDDASADCILRRIEESMQRLDVSVLDFYQVWNIQNQQCFEDATKPGGMIDGIKMARKRGLVRHIGITTHDSSENLLHNLDSMDWCEVILVSYNILNKSYAPVLEKAKQLGIGTIVMNPVGGGTFAEHSPMFDELLSLTGSVSCADLAIRYVLSNPDVDTIISGISKISDVDASMGSLMRPLFDATTLQKIDTFLEGLSVENVHFCTNCGYCMPCPQEVNIPKVMEAIYNYRYLGFKKNAKQLYKRISSVEWIKGNDAAACINCGICTPKCTQNLPIPEEMNFAREHMKQE